MKKLNECEIALSYKEKSINTEKLLKLFHANGKHNGHDEHIAYCEHFGKDEYALFNITHPLTEYWGYYGIKFHIYLHIENNRVTSCAISKFKYTGGYHGRPSTHVLSPTQQELRIFRRIMDYITK